MSQNQEISKKEQYNLNKLQKRLRRNVGEPLTFIFFNVLNIISENNKLR